MGWVLVIGSSWLLLSVLTALLIARSVRLADLKAEQATKEASTEPNFVVDVPHLRPVGAKEAAEAVTPPKPRDAPTIPGIPSARPKLGKPAVHRRDRPSARRTGLG
jgi:hypothetical protein